MYFSNVFFKTPVLTFSLLVNMSVCESVCLFVPLQVIVDYVQTITFLFFCKKNVLEIFFGIFLISKDINTSLLHRLQAQTLTDATPPLG